MNINALKKSKYLTKEDVGDGKLLTIRGDVVVEVSQKDSGEEEELHILFFEECEKGMVLKPVNGQLIAKITGSDDTENWAGHKVVLYNDPTVIFGGQLRGGIRVRAPRQQARAATGTPKAAAPRVAPPRAAAPVRRAAAPAPSDNDGGPEDPNWLPPEDGEVVP